MKCLASTHIYFIWVAQSYPFYQRNRSIVHGGERDTRSEAVVSLRTVVTFMTCLISRTETEQLFFRDRTSHFLLFSPLFGKSDKVFRVSARSGTQIGFKSILLTDLRSDIPDLFEIERYFVQEDLLSHEYSPPRLSVSRTKSLV